MDAQMERLVVEGAQEFARRHGQENPRSNPYFHLGLPATYVLVRAVQRQKSLMERQHEVLASSQASIGAQKKLTEKLVSQSGKMTLLTVGVFLLTAVISVLTVVLVLKG